MRTRRAFTLVGLLVMGIVLAGCPTVPPPPVTGVVDLGPLGAYGVGGGPGSIFSNIDHAFTEPEHQVRLSVVAYNNPSSRGTLILERTSPAEDAVLPTVGEYSSSLDGWTAFVTVNWSLPYEVTELSITELSYRAGVDVSQSDVEDYAYAITRLRATFTYLLASGEEVQGSVSVG